MIRLLKQSLWVAALGLCLCFPSNASTLYAPDAAYVDLRQEWMLQRSDGNLLRISVVSTVAASYWGTSAYLVGVDTLTGDSFFVGDTYHYWATPSTDSSVVIPSMSNALSIAANWITSHSGPYAGATLVEFNEIDVYDLPDWNSFSYLTPMDASLDWWVDLDSSGARFTNSEPNDFGAWTWDGNPIP